MRAQAQSSTLPHSAVGTGTKAFPRRGLGLKGSKPGWDQKQMDLTGTRTWELSSHQGAKVSMKCPHGPTKA